MTDGIIMTRETYTLVLAMATFSGMLRPLHGSLGPTLWVGKFELGRANLGLGRAPFFFF